MGEPIEISPEVGLVLDALGNQTRRDILGILRDRPMAVGAITEHFRISRPAVSKHLRILRGAKLVEYRADGASNVFCLNPDGFQEARVYLDQFWDEALLNFKRLAEETDEVHE
ncbi:MAG: ArsR/SmtB family transcription factor [Rubrobacteraceae bacterium]